MTYNGEYRPQDDLVVGYRLDNLYDYSGNVKTLTNNGSVAFSEVARPDGTTGKVAAFGSPNTAKYLRVTSTSGADIDINLTTNPVTLAAWIYISALPAASAYPTFLHWDAHQTDDRYVAIWYKNDGGTYKLQADFSGNITTYSVTLTVDTWYFVVLTAASGAGGATALYLNGAQVATGTKGTSAGAGTTCFQIGKHISQAQYWPGNIYQVAAFKKVFTATEILDWDNYQIGTAQPDIYVSLDGTKLNAYVSTNEGVASDGGDIELDVSSIASLDYPSLAYGGRNERVYSFRLINDTRATIDTLMGLINNAEEMDVFTPFCQDRAVYIKKAQAVISAPIMYWPTSAGRWYYVLDCKIYAIDSFQYGYKKNILVGENYILPGEMVTITNNGTYKSGIDSLVVSGYYDSGGPTYSTDLTLTLNDQAIVLCDRLLQGDAFSLNRYGRISHEVYTDFDDTISNIQNYFDSVEGAPSAATSGYHLSGQNPMTNLSNQPEDGLMIKVDASTTYSKINLTIASCTTLATTAADLQTKIRALGGVYAAVSVTVVDNRLKIISGTTGVASKVRVRSSADDYGDDCCYLLKIGTGPKSAAEPTVMLVGEDHDGEDASTPYIYAGDGIAGYSQSYALPATVINGAGYHVSGMNPETKLYEGYGTYGKFKIQNDSEASATEITLTLANCTSGISTAAEMQVRIRAIGAAYASVRVVYEYASYTIISQKISSDSAVVITAGDTVDISSALKLGTVNGGTSYDGSATLKNKFKIQADTEATATTITLTLYQAFTNDPAAGSNITLNMTNTGLFEVGDTVLVMSSAGYEVATVNLVTTDTSIRVAALALNHTTTNAFVVSYTTSTICAREIEDAIQAVGGAYADVTVQYEAGRYYFTSGTTGLDSKIRLTAASSNDISDRLKIGTAYGGRDVDGCAGSVSKNACNLSKYGRFMIPFFGPMISSSPPYIEFWVSSIANTPKAAYVNEDDEIVYLPDEIIQGYNKIWFPDLQAATDIRIGVYCGADSSVSIWDMTARVNRDVSVKYLPTIEPGETMEITLSCGGSLKLSEVELFYRDAFWS